jgi:hypothetical protein
LNPFHNFTSYFSKFRLNIALPFVPTSLKCSLVLHVLNQHVVRISKTSHAAKTPNRLTLRDLTNLPVLCEENSR